MLLVTEIGLEVAKKSKCKGCHKKRKKEKSKKIFWLPKML